MREFKLRASASGQLMTNGRAKSEMGKTAYGYLEDWTKEQIYGVRKEVKSKYLTKGIEMEDKAIDTAIQWLDLPFVIKNEAFYEDDHFTGTPDIVTADEVLDIKCSWDCFTFPTFDSEIPNKDYYYQLQVYMHLTDKRKARLVYVLLDTPADLTFGYEPVSYESVDRKYRIKSFTVYYDEAVISELKNRVMLGRDYIQTLIQSI